MTYVHKRTLPQDTKRQLTKSEWLLITDSRRQMARMCVVDVYLRQLSFSSDARPSQVLPPGLYSEMSHSGHRMRQGKYYFFDCGVILHRFRCQSARVRVLSCRLQRSALTKSHAEPLSSWHWETQRDSGCSHVHSCHTKGSANAKIKQRKHIFFLMHIYSGSPPKTYVYVMTTILKR